MVRIVSCIRCNTQTKFIPAGFIMAKSRETHQICVMGHIRNFGHGTCEKIYRKLVRIVSCIRCNTQTKFVPAVLIVAKSRQTHQNMSFGYNKVDWTRSLQKKINRKFVRIVPWIRCNNRTKFVPADSIVAKLCKTHQNMSFWSNKVLWAW